VSDGRASPSVVVVVPTRNSALTLRSCLESLRAQSYPCTVVVVDNGSTDGTSLAATELADLVLTAGPERSAQRNIGARALSSSIVGFVDSDMILSPGVVEEVVAAVEAGATSVVVPEITVGEGFWARVSAYERNFYDGNTNIEAPRFFPSLVFMNSGGFDESMTGAEDWDLGLRTAASGPRVRIQAEIVHDEGRVRYFNTCWKKAYYAPGVALFIRKHGTGSLLGMAARPWLRQPRALLEPLGLGLLILKIGQALAMLVALGLSIYGVRVRLPRKRDSNLGAQL
jgi:glycosyltransferase involved in cell wall biosynthesis